MNAPEKRDRAAPTSGTPLGVHRLGGRSYMLVSDAPPPKKAAPALSQQITEKKAANGIGGK